VCRRNRRDPFQVSLGHPEVAQSPTATDVAEQGLHRIRQRDDRRALPPLLVRTPVPSLVAAAVAAGLGWHARRRGAGRLGVAAIVAAVIGAGGAVATCSAGVGHLDAVVVWSALLVASLRYATPVLFAALGGIISERSGVIALGLEGMILVGAYFGTDITGSWIAGLGLAVAAGLALAMIHAVWSIALRGDQVISGIAINLLALRLTGYLFIQRYGEQGTPPDLPQIPSIHLAFLEGTPFVGEALGRSNVMTWGVALAAVLVSVFLFRTPAGLRLRAVGEYPDAAASSGLRVRATRYLAVLASGALAALGGAYLSIGFVHSFTRARAYLGDMPHPLKHRSALGSAFKEAELHLEEAICAHFEIKSKAPLIKRLDRAMLATERRAFAADAWDWPELEGVAPLDIDLEAWSPDKSAEEFTRRYFELDSARGS
jgi:general nucleoside transport system permease protein